MYALRAECKRFALPLFARVLRFTVVVPLTALTLHHVQPQVPWWSWCGVSAVSLLFLWLVDGCIAYSRRRERRRTAASP